MNFEKVYKMISLQLFKLENDQKLSEPLLFSAGQKLLKFWFDSLANVVNFFEILQAFRTFEEVFFSVLKTGQNCPKHLKIKGILRNYVKIFLCEQFL